jgi:hypothetical protein
VHEAARRPEAQGEQRAAAGWSAAAAVNQRLAVTVTVNVPGRDGARSISFTFSRPSVFAGALYCHSRPDRPTGASVTTCWTIGVLSPSSSRIVTGSLGENDASGTLKDAVRLPLSFFVIAFRCRCGSSTVKQLHRQVERHGPAHAAADAPSQLSGVSVTPFPQVCGSQASPKSSRPRAGSAPSFERPPSASPRPTGSRCAPTRAEATSLGVGVDAALPEKIAALAKAEQRTANEDVVLDHPQLHVADSPGGTKDGARAVDARPGVSIVRLRFELHGDERQQLPCRTFAAPNVLTVMARRDAPPCTARGSGVRARAGDR